jgi:large subunit ribosomal protein L18
MPTEKNSRKLRLARHERVRRKVSGTPARPRLCVFRSLRHIYAQVIDDVNGRTVASVSSVAPGKADPAGKVPKKDMAKMVGIAIAKRMLAEGTTQVVFDRGGYKYHGRVKSLADGAREGGLVF